MAESTCKTNPRICPLPRPWLPARHRRPSFGQIRSRPCRCPFARSVVRIVVDRPWSVLAAPVTARLQSRRQDAWPGTMVHVSLGGRVASSSSSSFCTIVLLRTTLSGIFAALALAHVQQQPLTSLSDIPARSRTDDLLSGAPPPLDGMRLRKLAVSGPAENRVNIVFFGDGCA